MCEISVSKQKRWLMCCLLLGLVFFCASPVLGGPYLESAHGNSSYGVDRTSLDAKYSGFATGNCAHCHETHASIEGEEPSPVGGPASHTLFAEGFNTSRTQNRYVESDNFCFYCHSNSSGPMLINQDYSATFGGGSTGEGPQSIMEAFNLASYHNLYDIWSFLNSDPEYNLWFAKLGNPCSACHNSHLAKRNWDSSQFGFPLLGTISKPGISDSLWGETEVMSAYLGYESPYADNGNLEPAGIGIEDGTNTPDYVDFCTTCHTPDKIIASTSLNRDLRTINWGQIGISPDKHGTFTRDGTDHFREPYASAAALKNNFTLSCLDCHESHGSKNIMMVRRRINGEDLEGVVDSTDTMSYICKRCHTDDLASAAGTGAADRWESVHHLATDAPYVEANCLDCHSVADGSSPIACGNCHGHGMDDSVLGTLSTGRRTF